LFDRFMTSTTYPSCTGNVVSERLEVLFGELAELAGQRNAIDARIVEIAAEMERDGLCGATGARSVAALVARDATCEVWFERHGQVIGAGRETRLINRRLRRALEHRDRCCVVPRLRGPPAACTPTTSTIGKTAATPNWPTC
jgi:hypothetical protein